MYGLSSLPKSAGSSDSMIDNLSLSGFYLDCMAPSVIDLASRLTSRLFGCHAGLSISMTNIKETNLHKEILEKAEAHKSVFMIATVGWVRKEVFSHRPEKFQLLPARRNLTPLLWKGKPIPVWPTLWLYHNNGRIWQKLRAIHFTPHTVLRWACFPPRCTVTL